MIRNKTSVFEISHIDYSTPLDTQDDNLDIHVKLKNGKKFVATFFTLENISTIMNRHKESGECAFGKYFWASNMIIVESLSYEVISKAVQDLIENDEFEMVFDRVTE